MKKFFVFFALALAMPCFAADNIKMVTYFPVPYLAYNELGVVGTCDLGLMGTCGLDAGKYLSVRPNAGVAQSGLNRGVLALKGSELDLQSTALSPHVQSYVLRVGDQPTSKAQEALLTFRHRLEVGSLQGDLQSIEADNTAYMDSLTLFGSTFPACTRDDHRISWQRLTFDYKESTFLVCGNAVSDKRCPMKLTYTATGPGTTTRPAASADTCDGDVDKKYEGGTRLASEGNCVDYYSVPAGTYEGNQTIVNESSATFTTEDTSPAKDHVAKYTCTASELASKATILGDVYRTPEYTWSVNPDVRYCSAKDGPTLCTGTNFTYDSTKPDDYMFYQKSQEYKAAGGRMFMSGESSGWTNGSEQDFCDDLEKIGWLKSGGTYTCTLKRGVIDPGACNGSTDGTYIPFTCKGGTYRSRVIVCDKVKLYKQANWSLDCSN